MLLSPGTRLGPYEILAAIGAGGMGEVYRARDAKLNRDVALKILPDAFATDPDRLSRFRREAQVLASLNHPNIGHIYGFEDGGATLALVLELVEGPTLADRIAAGAIPLDEALPIARQIADALEAAHEQGIVHRDLKPANVKVRDDGTVKVLDFGLAKAFDPAASSGADAMHSPTLTARATQMGLIIGTAAYMAPEQARGRAVDRRADIWAFGVVLFEMLTGRRAFDGDDISITLAAVLKDDLTWTAWPVDLPSPVRRLLRRCLEKDPKRRLSSIGDARLELEEVGSVFLSTPAIEFLPMFSPDGRWIAYQSNDSGRNEVFVRPFPGPGGKWQISTGEGSIPIWSRTRPELLYVHGERIMAASYTATGDGFHADKPHEWTPAGIRPLNGGYLTVDLHPDGKRLAVMKRPDGAEQKRDKVVFVFNFFDELRRVAPIGK